MGFEEKFSEASKIFIIMKKLSIQTKKSLRSY